MWEGSGQASTQMNTIAQHTKAIGAAIRAPKANPRRDLGVSGQLGRSLVSANSALPVFFSDNRSFSRAP